MSCKLLKGWLGLAALAAFAAAPALAAIPAPPGPNYAFTARPAHISAGDGLSVYVWTYGLTAGTAQYPGPNIVITEGTTVTIDLTNELDVPTSIVFPGQSTVTATGGTLGLLTREAAPGETVSYSFLAANPGTYQYHSGTNPELQIEMGLVGAIVVRPMMGADHAYNDMDTMFHDEYLFLLTEMDIRVHETIECGHPGDVDLPDYFSVYWFLNGRNLPDTMAMDFDPWLPTQPYSCMPMTHPGHAVLLRFIGAGRDSHPFHLHGNHFQVIAYDGRLLESAPGAGPDLSEMKFTVTVSPGRTADALWSWTGEGLNWDVYGHAQDIDNTPTGNFPGPEDVDHNGNGTFDNVPMEMNEYEPDHGKPFPVNLPDTLDMTAGAHWSGSPFLGAQGYLPPGAGPLNIMGEFQFMWHSHAEKELTNYDIFPGGMATMGMVMPPMMPLAAEPGR